jgi:hypothetical protein
LQEIRRYEDVVASNGIISIPKRANGTKVKIGTSTESMEI